MWCYSIETPTWHSSTLIQRKMLKKSKSNKSLELKVDWRNIYVIQPKWWIVNEHVVNIIADVQEW